MNVWIVMQGSKEKMAPMHVDVSHYNANQTVLELLDEEISGPYTLHEYVEIKRYSHAIDLLQALLTTYGCKTKQWEEARTLIDQERPILKESKE